MRHTARVPQIRIAQNDAADDLLGRDPLALVVGMLLDQQFAMERAFAAPRLLADRLGVDVLSAADLAETTYLTANVFAGSTGTEVTVAIDGGEAKGAQRTQSMTGEARKIGALWSDPVAVQEQLVHGGSVAESSMHIWRSALPADLAAGEHTATVTSTDRDGTVSTETIEFTVTD